MEIQHHCSGPSFRSQPHGLTAADLAAFILVRSRQHVCNQRLRFPLDLREMVLTLKTLGIQFVHIFRA